MALTIIMFAVKREIIALQKKIYNLPDLIIGRIRWFNRQGSKQPYQLH